MFKKTSRSFAFVLALALIAPATRMFAQTVVSGGDPQPKGDAVSTLVVVLTTLTTM